ncbi:MAG: AAA family ATPase [Pseudomonadota bacterium]
MNFAEMDQRFAQHRTEHPYTPEGSMTPDGRSQFYSAATLKGKPVKQREWLVHGLIPQKTVTLFGGDGGTGKSLLALQLAVAVATSGGWIGKGVSGGRVIYMSAEDDDDELHRRLDDILRAERLTYDDLSGLTMRSLAGEDALLAVDSQMSLMRSELFKELDGRAADESPTLIVIDTLADVYPANENDRAKVRQFIGILRGLALKRGCAVLLLGHPSLTGLNSGTGASGSTAWNNSVRSRLYLSRITDNGFEADPDRRVMTTMKANYGRIGEETHMKWQTGVFVPELSEQGLDKLAAGAKAQRVFMNLLATFTAQGRQVNHAGGPSYAPKQFAEHPDSEGMTKRAFKAAMDSLLASGKIRIAKEGPASRQRSFIVEADQ